MQSQHPYLIPPSVPLFISFSRRRTLLTFCFHRIPFALPLPFLAFLLFSDK